jgi:hypothetical protein
VAGTRTPVTQDIGTDDCTQACGMAQSQVVVVDGLGEARASRPEEAPFIDVVSLTEPRLTVYITHGVHIWEVRHSA